MVRISAGMHMKGSEDGLATTSICPQDLIVIVLTPRVDA